MLLDYLKQTFRPHERVPSVARLVEYGKSVCATGYRKTLYAAALPTIKSDSPHDKADDTVQ